VLVETPELSVFQVERNSGITLLELLDELELLEL